MPLTNLFNRRTSNCNPITITNSSPSSASSVTMSFSSDRRDTTTTTLPDDGSVSEKSTHSATLKSDKREVVNLFSSDSDSGDGFDRRVPIKRKSTHSNTLQSDNRDLTHLSRSDSDSENGFEHHVHKKSKKQILDEMVAATHEKHAKYKSSTPLELRISPKDYDIIDNKSAKSSWWKHFSIFNLKDLPTEKRTILKNLAVCKLCLQLAEKKCTSPNPSTPIINFTVDLGSEKSTSKMSNHMKTFHLNDYRMTQTAVQDAKSTSASHGPMDSFIKADGEKCYEQTMKLIVHTSLPHSIVEHPAWREYMNFIKGKNYVPMTRHHISKSVLYKSSKMAELISSLLRKHDLSFTTDSWTSTQNLSYTALTCHWITHLFEMRSLSLSVEFHPGSSTAEALYVQLSQILSRFGLHLENIATLTTDTNSTMAKLGKLLHENVSSVWIPCIDHRIQLISKLAFDDTNLPGVDNTMQKARKLVTFFKHSSQATFALRSLQVIFLFF